MRLDKNMCVFQIEKILKGQCISIFFVGYIKSYYIQYKKCVNDPAQLINNINTAYPDSYSYTTTKHFPFL